MADRAAMIGGIALLERAMNYALGSLALTTDDALPRATPCDAWDVRALLMHMNDALAALADAVDVGRVALEPAADEPAAGLVASVRERGCVLLGAWTNAAAPGVVSIGGRPLPSTIVAAIGALEVAAHGWDLAQGCGIDRPIPAALAEELLELAPLMVTADDRPSRFRPQVKVSARSGPDDRLIAFLGRNPRWRMSGRH